MNRELEPQAVQHSPDYWGINNDYNVLTDVLLGKPEYFKWVEAGPLIGRTLRNMHKTGIKFDFDLAQRQHAEMVRIYEEEAGVTYKAVEASKMDEAEEFAAKKAEEEAGEREKLDESVGTVESAAEIKGKGRVPQTERSLISYALKAGEKKDGDDGPDSWSK